MVKWPPYALHTSGQVFHDVPQLPARQDAGAGFADRRFRLAMQGHVQIRPRQRQAVLARSLEADVRQGRNQAFFVQNVLLQERKFAPQRAPLNSDFHSVCSFLSFFKSQVPEVPSLKLKSSPFLTWDLGLGT